MYKKLLSTLLALCMVLTLMPVAVAATADENEGESTYSVGTIPGGFTTTAILAEGFSSNYSLSDNSANNMVNIAVAQVGRNKGTMGYYNDWCASFVSDVASKAGEASAIPYNAGCRQLYNAIINAGGREISTPQKGDIVFFVCTVCKVYPYDNAYSHVGIMVDGNGNCISGNYNGKVSQHKVGNYGYEPHFVSTGDIILKYVRPNYKLTSSANPVQPEITLSQSSVSMQAGSSTTVTVGTKSPGACYVRAYSSNSDVCGYSWGSWNSTGTAIPLMITGKSTGKASMTVIMYDNDTKTELTRKEINVSVIAPAQSTSPNLNVDTINTLNRTGDASLYPTVFKGYLRGTDKYEAYADSSGGKSIGRIYPSDELKVQSVYSNNGTLWISALCPWDGYSSDRLIYTKLDAMVNTGFTPFKAIADSSATVYTRADASQKYGSLGKGDAVTVVGQSGQYVQIIYPLAAGGYKIGWCQISGLVRTAIVDVQANSSTSVTLKCAIPSNAANYVVIMDANQRELTRSSISRSRVNIRNMTRGVTYYYYIESVLSNGTGSVTSAVKRVVLN